MKMPFSWFFIEIERKFLVYSDGWREAVYRTSDIRQSYLPGAIGVTTRVRSVNGRSRITCKTAKIGISRGEFEIAIPSAHAELIFGLCSLPAIEKTRHYVIDQGSVWHVDVFSGRHQGLIVAEIELSHPAQSFSLPDWVGDEVTHDRRFSNSNLYEMTTFPDGFLVGRIG